MRRNGSPDSAAFGGVDGSLVEARQLMTEAEHLSEDDPPAAAKLLRRACKQLSRKGKKGHPTHALMLSEAKLLLSNLAENPTAQANYILAALDHNAQAVEETSGSPLAMESWMMALAVASVGLSPADLWHSSRRMAAFAQERFEAGDRSGPPRRLWLTSALTLARAAVDSEEPHLSTRIDTVTEVWDSIVAHMPKNVDALTTAAMVRRMVAPLLAESDRAAARECLLDAVRGLEGVEDAPPEHLPAVYMAQADALSDLALDMASDRPETASYLARTREKLEAATEAAPHDETTWDYLAWACFEHGEATDDLQAREDDAATALEALENLIALDAHPQRLERAASSVLAAAADWLPDTASRLPLLRRATEALRLIEDQLQDQERLLGLRAVTESTLGRELLLADQTEEAFCHAEIADEVYERWEAMAALEASSLLHWGHVCLVAAETAADADEKTRWYRRACTRLEQASELAPGNPGMLTLWSIALTGAAHTLERVADRSDAMRLAAEKASAAVEVSPETAASAGELVLSVNVARLASSDDYDQPSVLPALGHLRKVLEDAGSEIPLIIRSRLDAALGLEDEAIQSLRSALGVGSLAPEDLEDDLLLASLRDRPEFAELQELHTPRGSSSRPKRKRTTARSPLDRPLPGLDSDADEAEETG